MDSRNSQPRDRRQQEQHADSDDERPTKKAKLDGESIASILLQTAHIDTSLEVDHMILDYIAYQSIEACLRSRGATSDRASSVSLSRNLVMYQSFLPVFKARHPHYVPDAEFDFRMLLLKLVALFTQRLTRNPSTPSRSALDALRCRNRERARSWLRGSGSTRRPAFDTVRLRQGLPIASDHLTRNRAEVLLELNLPAEDEFYEDAFYGTIDCVALLDLIPLFMEVSCARNIMSGSSVNAAWMQLACNLMLQACLEQYLVYGAIGFDPSKSHLARDTETAC
jgi:hypothetical protein